MQQEQTEETDRLGEGLEGCDGETSTAGTVEVETSVMACEDNQEEEKKRGHDSEGEREVPDPPPQPPATISAEEPEESSGRPESLTETSTSPDPVHQVQRHQPGGPQVSRWDKSIIEKIRSYYEAAAKAEEGEEEEEEEQREGVWWRRRSSFSEIPSGLVKDSVSQFDVGEHQWEERTKAQSSPPEETDPPTRSLDLLLGPGPSADVTQDQKSPNRGGSVREEVELPRRREKVCSQPGDGPQEETLGRGREASSNQNQHREGTSPRNPARANEAPAAESSSKEQFREPAERSGSRTGSSCTRTCGRDPAAAHQSSAGMEAGSCSQKTTTVSANRVLFEATTSHVAGIGLFEAGPAVDLVLMENSARILSRVQTLALMYSTKGSSMKLPLHQKQADKPSLASTRPTHQNRVQSQNPREEQLHSEKTKEPGSRCGNHTKVQHQHQPQNQTGSRTGTHGQARVDGTGTQGQDRAGGTGTNSQDLADETGTHGQDRVVRARTHSQDRVDGARTHSQEKVDGTGTHDHEQVDRTRTHGHEQVDRTRTHSQDRADGRCYLSDHP